MQMAVNDEQRERILASGLFDPAFYRKTYGPEVDAGGDPLRHYLVTGLARGHLPSAGFDPVLYRVLVPGCGGANPLLRHIESKKPWQPPSLLEVFPEAVKRISYGHGVGSFQRLRNQAYAVNAANARKIGFAVDDRRYELTVPEPDAFLQRLRADRPFSMVRLSEGYWEAWWMLRAAETALAEDPRTRAVSVPERHVLAARLCAAVRPRNGMFTPSFSDEVLGEIAAHAAHPDFFRSVSFKGYPTHDEQIAGRRTLPPREELARLFSEYFRPDEIIYDGTLWKRLLIAGHLKALPDLCRGHPVVLVGPGIFSGLRERWRLDAYTHVEIPPSLSQCQRWDILERARAAVESARAAGSRSPIVLTQCGSLAHWLVTRLFPVFPGAFYLDLGQALDGWFFDQLDLKPPWTRIYARSVIVNCGLESYYRALMGADYDAWFASLP
jgi:hypothetical protein